MPQKFTLEITKVLNGSTVEEEKVWLKATAPISTKGFALVDRTFDENEKVSNEFRHIYVFPEYQLAKDQAIVVYTTKGTNGFKKYNNSNDKYLALYWGSEECVWNDNGKDTATLINFIPVNSVAVPAVNKKA